jgi:hypothetical protein
VKCVSRGSVPALGAPDLQALSPEFNSQSHQEGGGGRGRGGGGGEVH